MSATAKSQVSGRVLVMTIGTGNLDRLEETLFRPLTLSLETGEWQKAVLLPSERTGDLCAAS